MRQQQMDLHESIERSYKELREQLALALGCDAYRREAGMVCGYNRGRLCDKDPGMYLGIKLNALHCAWDKLLRNKDSSRKYDKMLWRYDNASRGKKGCEPGGREGRLFHDGHGLLGYGASSHEDNALSFVCIDSPTQSNKVDKDEDAYS